MINSFILVHAFQLIHLSIMNKFKNPTTGRFFINNNDHEQILRANKDFLSNKVGSKLQCWLI